jgi:hypothetical protein
MAALGKEGAMWFHRRRQTLVAEGPVVYDRRGRPVGVHVTAPPEAETRAARRHRELAGLRRTHELEAQYGLRCQVSLFCADPPR